MLILNSFIGGLVVERLPCNLNVPGSNPTRGVLLDISVYALTPTYGTVMGYLPMPEILIRSMPL